MGSLMSHQKSVLTQENEVLRSENLQLNKRLLILEEEITKIKNNSSKKSNLSEESLNALENKMQASVKKLVNDMLKNNSINSSFIPDYIERKLYINIFTVLISMIKEVIEDTSINIFNQNIKFSMEPLANSNL